jgi:hypothetical protein
VFLIQGGFKRVDPAIWSFSNSTYFVMEVLTTGMPRGCSAGRVLTGQAVGYGDLAPKESGGRVFVCMCAAVLPAGSCCCC